LKNLFNQFDDDEDKDFMDIGSFQLVYTNCSKKSILFSKDGLKVQLIYFQFFNSTEEIFKTFDFTACMGAYNCATEEFELHPDFLKDVAQRRLVVNPNTAFPIISLLRVDKYKQKGYEISRKDFVNLCLATNRLDLGSWEKVSDAIGGMYGYNHNDIFDTTKPYSIDEVINQLTVLESRMESTDTISGLEFDALVEHIEANLGIAEKKDPTIFYKKVIKTSVEGVYESYYHSHFKYPNGQIINGGDYGIWAYKSLRKAKKHFSNTGKREAVIKLQASKDVTVIPDGAAFNIKGNLTVLGEVTT
jgi:hypothetical protein